MIRSCPHKYFSVILHEYKHIFVVGFYYIKQRFCFKNIERFQEKLHLFKIFSELL